MEDRTTRELIVDLSTRFDRHIQDEMEFRAEVLAAFPGNDPNNHRVAHEAMIRAAEAQERFYNELKLDLAKNGVRGFVVIVIGLIVTGAVIKLKSWGL